MIVARSFSPPAFSFLKEKNDLNGSHTRSNLRQRSSSPQRSTRSPSRMQTPSSFDLRSDPVKIPSRSAKHAQLQAQPRSVPINVKPNTSTDRHAQATKLRRGSAKDILSATTIPVRRNPKGRPSQRLPKGDHVADFSRLLLDDIHANKDVGLTRIHSLPQMDGLFGNIDELVEGQLFVGSEGLDESALSARSISSESLASLASPDDYSSSNLECRLSAARSLQGRLTPRISHSEDCSNDHPLASLDEIEELSLSSPELSPSQPTVSQSTSRTTSPPPRPIKKEVSRSFKSTLTSSLKALKSAARTTLLSSGYGPHGSANSSGLYTSQSLLAHNFFDIQPSLTDDRRPPPTMTRPSPELRRYLNPQMATAPADSPTQLHFWQDERYAFDAKKEAQIVKDKIKQRSRRRRSPGPRSKIDSLPSVVPLSTCLPPTVRTANASSPPIWLTPDGRPVNRATSTAPAFDPDITLINGMSKNREPRENRDFLRMYVCEAAMRRNGKLSDDLSAGRARLWLPPLAGFQNTANSTQAPKKVGAERWQVWTADDVAQ